ncbi:hypothetical protein A7U60_g2319 [Sanghuangporus baumii]|uniref:Uncharacterized protein n=1 Tax=Sanghuangporus baumii TaxID=108892 RepID=A0A9Q5N8A1_SANBA|nr:hypothetical protein A7U60_g2319 [Sanghuangporus baumii]
MPIPNEPFSSRLEQRRPLHHARLPYAHQQLDGKTKHQKVPQLLRRRYYYWKTRIRQINAGESGNGGRCLTRNQNKVMKAITGSSRFRMSHAHPQRAFLLAARTASSSASCSSSICSSAIGWEDETPEGSAASEA